jgi:hypothetical protein
MSPSCETIGRENKPKVQIVHRSLLISHINVERKEIDWRERATTQHLEKRWKPIPTQIRLRRWRVHWLMGRHVESRCSKWLLGLIVEVNGIGLVVQRAMAAVCRLLKGGLQNGPRVMRFSYCCGYWQCRHDGGPGNDDCVQIESRDDDEKAGKATTRRLQEAFC